MFSHSLILLRITEHGHHFYVHMETNFTDVGMRMRMRTCMRTELSVHGFPILEKTLVALLFM